MTVSAPGATLTGVAESPMMRVTFQVTAAGSAPDGSRARRWIWFSPGAVVNAVSPSEASSSWSSLERWQPAPTASAASRKLRLGGIRPELEHGGRVDPAEEPLHGGRPGRPEVGRVAQAGELEDPAD